MTIRYLEEHAALEGVVTVDDAQGLAEWLAQREAPAVHLGDCEHVHAAVLQVLLAFRPKLAGLPGDPWLASVLAAAE